MNLFRRLLAASGAAGLLLGLGGATQAYAAFPFTANILSDCVLVGQSQTITVHSASGTVVHIEVTINGSITNGGTQNGTGVTDASGNFRDQWTIATVAQVSTATVRVWTLAAAPASTGQRDFQIHPASSPCQTTSSATFSGSEIDTQQAGGEVKKTCDAGVSGNAVFTPTIHIHVSYSTSLSTTFTLPASVALTLACNGESKALPVVLPVTSIITLHESTLPTGAAAAADTNITVTASPAAVATIHNTKAVAPVVPVLPQAGQPASTPMLPWPAIALIGLLAAVGGALILRRRS